MVHSVYTFSLCIDFMLFFDFIVLLFVYVFIVLILLFLFA